MGSAIIHTPSGDKPERETTKHQKEGRETLVKENDSSLTRKQQVKQDALLWAQFLYGEYKRKKALEEGVNNI